MYQWNFNKITCIKFHIFLLLYDEETKIHKELQIIKI